MFVDGEAISSQNNRKNAELRSSPSTVSYQNLRKGQGGCEICAVSPSILCPATLSG
jgi:hypothetical protein